MSLARAVAGDGPLRPYDCGVCAAHPWMRDAQGHDGPPQNSPTNLYTHDLLTGQPLTRCPVRERQLLAESNPALVREVDRMADYFVAYGDGHLLSDGGLGDQPARYAAYMLAFGDQRARVRAKLDEIAAANAPRGEA